ncbi:hypothetical protein LRQ10_30400, partial [Pseudomonas sp. MAFF 311094]|nr:hypothetical protein [Pseudomonas petroselini]
MVSGLVVVSGLAPRWAVHYMETPWTRDGRVRADIINVAADVTGEVVDVPVRDNQRVKRAT